MITIYGIKPNLTDENGVQYGTVRERLSTTLGRKEIFFESVVGRNKAIYEGFKEFEVKQPPIIVKHRLPYRLGSKDFMNSRETYG